MFSHPHNIYIVHTRTSEFFFNSQVLMLVKVHQSHFVMTAIDKLELLAIDRMQATVIYLDNCHQANVYVPCGIRRTDFVDHSAMAPAHCVIKGCKTSIFNKAPSVSFHPCPTSMEMRNQWLHVLKNRCAILDWSKSRICSKHFENKYMDSQRRLKPNAVPTLFPALATESPSVPKPIVKPSDPGRTKLDKALSKLTQAELMSDIKFTLARMKEPINLNEFVNDDLKCRADAPVEAKLWVLIKKQEYLNNMLTESVLKNNKQLEVLQKNLADTRSGRKEMEQNIENYKYVVKCLQEKQATLEEQIEILTAIESR